jgi:hypothetical protein
MYFDTVLRSTGAVMLAGLVSASSVFAHARQNPVGCDTARFVPDTMVYVEEDEFPELTGAIAAGCVRMYEGEQTRGSRLTPADLMMDGRPFHLWRYEGRAGHQLLVTAASSEFDVIVGLGVMDEGRFLLLAVDESGGGSESELAVDLAAGATYLVVVTGTRGVGEGAYTLRVESSPAESAARLAERHRALAERAYLTVMRSELRNLATHQEAYAADNNGEYMPGGRATSAVPHLGYESSAGVTVVIERHRYGWSAVATHESLPGRTCGMFIGLAAPPRGNPALTEGEPLCD